MEDGIQDARPLRGGFRAWKDAGMPVAAKERAPR